jgi:hypothetical protein
MVPCEDFVNLLTTPFKAQSNLKGQPVGPLEGLRGSELHIGRIWARCGGVKVFVPV